MVGVWGGRAHLPLPTPLGDARFGLANAPKRKLLKSQDDWGPHGSGCGMFAGRALCSGCRLGEEESDAALELACKVCGATVKGLKT